MGAPCNRKTQRNILPPRGVIRDVRLRLRWLLPAGHLLVDVVLATSLVVHSSGRFQSRKGDPGLTTALQPVMLSQEDASVGFDLTTLPPPDEFLVIMSGNPAAGFVSERIVPETMTPPGGVRSRVRPRDLSWFLLHEALSFSCWYVLGAWLDRSRARLGLVMIMYLAIRAAVAVTGFYEIGWRIQVVFWLGLSLSLLAFGFVRLCKAGWRATRRASA